MGGLREEEFTAVDVNGRGKPAKLQLCECGGREWFVFTIRVGSRWHPHVQCAACDAVYCDGSCGGEGALAAVADDSDTDSDFA